jgi:hypothetical protein
VASSVTHSLLSSDNSSKDRATAFYWSRLKGAAHKVSKTLLPLALRGDKQALRLKREKQRQFRIQERLYKVHECRLSMIS